MSGRRRVTPTRMISIALVSAALVVACGKTGGPGLPRTGLYHLRGASEATSLELRDDGTFTLRRESCASIGDLECGRWAPSDASAAIVTRDGLYWPTPDEFPSAVVRSVTLRAHGDELVVVGESAWAGAFTQRWQPGRTCAACDGAGERACRDPMPACSFR